MAGRGVGEELIGNLWGIQEVIIINLYFIKLG